MGDNVVGAIPAFAEHLRKQAAKGSPPAPQASSNSVYFDLCGLWMISYTASTAKWLHSAMLPLVLLFPPPGVRRAAMGKVAGMCLLSMLSCLALPAAVGGLRAMLSGVVVDMQRHGVFGIQGMLLAAVPSMLSLLCYACCAVLCLPPVLSPALWSCWRILFA